MNPMTIAPDCLEVLRQRRKSGERVSELAAELGVTWQRLEKLTRHAESPSTPNDLMQIKRELRQTRLLLATVPGLGCSKPWAIRWRNRICHRLRRRVALLQRRFHALNAEVGVPMKPDVFWRPRPASPSDARIRQQYNCDSTNLLWSQP